MPSDPYRVALLLDGETLQQWQTAALREMVSEPGVEVTTVVVDDRSTAWRDRIGDVVGDGLWGIVRTGRWLTRQVVPDAVPPYRRRTPLGEAEFLDGFEVLRVSPVSDGAWNELPAAALGALSDVDVAIRFGFGLLRGQALTAPSDGVLSFHHGDVRTYRGRPPGFWEYLHGAHTAGVTLQRLTETLDGGQVVAYRSVDISDARTWGDVADRLFAASEPMLADGIENLRSDRPEIGAPDDLGPLYTTPDWRATLRYLAKTVAGSSWRPFRSG